MKNDCVNNHCIFREEDGTCEMDIAYCKDYISPSYYEILPNSLNASEGFQKLDEDVTKLEKLSGYSLDKLIEMFAAGWTLEPPDKPLHLANY